MANHNPNPATRFPVNRGEKPVNLLREARIAEILTMDRLKDAKTDSLTFASLVRSFVALVDCIQRLRGIPTPGQYRPELSPQKLIAALKKANARTPIELMAAGTFHDEPGDEEGESQNPKVEPEEKESLLTKPEGEGQTGVGGGKEQGGA